MTRHGAHAEYIDSVTGMASPVWPCGLHYGPPWLQVSHLVTKQDIVFNTKIDGCPTRDNVSACIDLSIVLRVMGEDNPRNVVKFVHEFTPMGLQMQLQSALATSVRTLVRSFDHSSILGLRHLKCSQMEAESTGEPNDRISAMDAMKLHLNQQFTTQGIEILNIIVKEITLPAQIQHQLLQKTLISTQNNVQSMQHQQSMQSLLQEEEIKTLQQTHELEQRNLLRECEYDTTLAHLQLHTLQTENTRHIQSIEAQTSIDVGLVTVENNMTMQRLVDENKLETEKIRIQSKAHGTMELAKVESDTRIMLAKCELEVAKNVVQAEKTLRQARSLALASISESYADGNTTFMALSPRNVMDLGMLLGGEVGGGGGTLPCAAGADHRPSRRRGAQSLPDKRTLDRLQVLAIMAERHS